MHVHGSPDGSGTPYDPSDEERKYQVVCRDHQPMEQAEDDGRNGYRGHDAESVFKPVLHSTSTAELLDQRRDDDDGQEHRDRTERMPEEVGWDEVWPAG
jgi:hypothetical protein